MAVNKSHKQQLGVGETLARLARAEIYAGIHASTNPHKIRLQVNGKQVRVRTSFDEDGWFLPDPREFKTEGSDVVVFVDFTDMVRPVFFVVPMTWLQAQPDVKELYRKDLLQWLDAWDGLS